jgi:hypothetical protein
MTAPTVPGSWVNPSTVGGVLDLSTGNVISGTWITQILANLLWLGGTTGAFATNAVSLVQPSGTTIASSSTGSRYWQIGKLIVISVELAITGAGVSGQGMTLSGLLPSAQHGVAGTGIYQRTGGGVLYQVVGLWNTAYLVDLYGGNGTGKLGANPTFAAASGDNFWFTAVYEAP